MDGLDDFLNEGTTAAEPQIEAPEVEQQPETIGQPRDENGRFAPKGVETPQETAEPVTPTEQQGLPQEEFKGLKEERRKRQEAEQRLAAIEQQLKSLQEPAQAPPSLWEDEQGWQQHFGSQVAQQAAFNAKLDMSEMLARQSNPDFDDMKSRFLEMAQANPGLVNQALSDPHPWAKAYTLAKNAAKMEALGAVDVADLEAKIREQIKAEMAAQQPAAPAPQLPTSLADTQSARVAPAATQMLSLEDILSR
jgi:hypothetical protein